MLEKRTPNPILPLLSSKRGQRGLWKRVGDLPSRGCEMSVFKLQVLGLNAVCVGPLGPLSSPSVALDVSVDGSHEDARAEVADRAAHERQREAKDAGVSVVKEGLVQARHLGLEEVKMDRVPAKCDVNTDQQGKEIGQEQAFESVTSPNCPSFKPVFRSIPGLFISLVE